MKVLVTGGTGFIGQHYVREILRRGHDVTVLGRSESNFRQTDWATEAKFLCADIDQAESIEKLSGDGFDALVHLAWPGLGNFRDLAHFEINALASYRLIQRLVQTGCDRVVVTGTCLEYGLQQGCLDEAAETSPVIAYALGKDFLRRSLEMLRADTPFRMSWARLFYMHGPGQNPRSLLAQLDQAIQRGEPVFDMSGGEQLRDYSTVQDIARGLATVTESTSHHGNINVCSGTPISVRRLVEQHITQKQASIQLNLGHYPYPDYEPFAFWGNRTILTSLENHHE